ncbi:MAG: hypothetical protein EBY41_02835, partial [Proteobacteria bacterium]|nr:hypothetical protein [Pseudomonadota bacterium]
SSSAGTYTFSGFLKKGTSNYAGIRAVTNGFTNRFFQLFGSLIAIGGLLNLAYVAVHLLSIFFGPNHLLILITYLSIFIASIHISGWIIGQAISNFYATGVFIMLGYTGIWMFLSGLVV